MTRRDRQPEEPLETETIRDALTEHMASLRNRIRSRLGRSSEVDDLLQETLGRALASLATVRDADALRPWLLTIAERTVIDHLRVEGRRRRVLALPDEAADVHAAQQAGDPVEALEFWQIVARSVRQLPEEIGEPGRRYFLLGDSLAAIGRALGRSKSTIQSQVERARAALADRLAQSGHAALIPLLDIAQPIGLDLGVGGASRASRALGGKVAVGLAVAALTAVAFVLGSDLLPRSTIVAAPEPARPATVTTSTASFADVGTGEPGPAPATRTPAGQEPLVFGRVLDAVTGGPVVAARVHSFDYLHDRELPVHVTDERGEFRIEESRGCRQPFEVFVEPPVGRDLGRVQLDAVSPSTEPHTVTMQPSITAVLTVSTSSKWLVPLRDVEVTVIDVTGSGSPGLDWPADEGWDLRQLLPPSFTVLAHRVCSGELIDVSFAGLPDTRLGFFVRDRSGRSWFARSTATPTQSGTKDDERLAPTTRRRDVRVYLVDSTESQNIDRLCGPHARRRTVCDVEDLARYLADPNTSDYYAMLSDSLTEGWTDGRSLDADDRGFERSITACGLGIDPPLAPTVTPPPGALRVDLSSVPGLLATDASETFPVILRGMDDSRTIFGYRAAHTGDTLVFDGLPTDELMLLELLDGGFELVRHRALLRIPSNQRGLVDLGANTNTVKVRATIRDHALPGCTVSLYPNATEMRPTAAEREAVLETETDRKGNAQFEIVGLGAFELRTMADLEGATVELVEVGTISTDGSPDHPFDLGVGFALRITRSGQPLALVSDAKLVVEGEVAGPRRVSFREEVDVCDDGVVSVRTGVTGAVTARVTLCDENPVLEPGTVSATIRATAAALEPDSAPERVVLPVIDGEPRQVAINIRDMGGGLVPFDEESLAIAIRDPWTGTPRTPWPPPSWTTLPWTLRDGVVVVEVGAAAVGFELRIRTPQHATGYVHIADWTVHRDQTLDVRLAAGREVAIGADADEPFHHGEDLGRGLRVGDVVVGVCGRAVTSRLEFDAALADVAGGKALELFVRRGAATVPIRIPPPWRSFVDKLDFVTR